MAIELNFAERRVLGVLIEKAFTTPEQYPLSVNSVVVGSNQKSCREPMSSLDEPSVLETLESLRQKGFTTLVRGSRVDRWKQRIGETLVLDPKETAVLAELFLRGPQTDGELRQRASRMRPLETLEEVEQVLESLMSRPEPLVERLGHPGRRRGVKYAHTFYPASERPTEASVEYDARPAGPSEPEPLAAPPRSAAFSVASSPRATDRTPVAVSDDALLDLRRKIESLEERVAELEATFVKFLR